MRFGIIKIGQKFYHAGYRYKKIDTNFAARFNRGRVSTTKVFFGVDFEIKGQAIA